VYDSVCRHQPFDNYSVEHDVRNKADLLPSRVVEGGLVYDGHTFEQRYEFKSGP